MDSSQSSLAEFDSDSDTGGVFFGSRHHSESKFESVANILHTVKPRRHNDLLANKSKSPQETSPTAQRQRHPISLSACKPKGLKLTTPEQSIPLPNSAEMSRSPHLAAVPIAFPHGEDPDFSKKDEENSAYTPSTPLDLLESCSGFKAPEHQQRFLDHPFGEDAHDLDNPIDTQIPVRNIDVQTIAERPLSSSAPPNPIDPLLKTPKGSVGHSHMSTPLHDRSKRPLAIAPSLPQATPEPLTDLISFDTYTQLPAIGGLETGSLVPNGAAAVQTDLLAPTPSMNTIYSRSQVPVASVDTVPLCTNVSSTENGTWNGSGELPGSSVLHCSHNKPSLPAAGKPEGQLSNSCIPEIHSLAHSHPTLSQDLPKQHEIPITHHQRQAPTPYLTGQSDDVDKEASDRARKRARRSPERELVDDRQARLRSLSPDSADVLSALFTQSPTRSNGLPQATVAPVSNSTFISPGKASLRLNARTIPSQTNPIGLRSPAGRVPLSPDRIFFSNPLDNPNRSPARRVLVSIAPTSPSKIRGTSVESHFSPSKPSYTEARRARSADPVFKPLPFPVSEVSPLSPLTEEGKQNSGKSSLKAVSKIPRPHGKPYARPVQTKHPIPSPSKLAVPDLDAELNCLSSPTLPSRTPFSFPLKIDGPSSVSPVKRQRTDNTELPTRPIARPVISGMFDKSSSAPVRTTPECPIPDKPGSLLRSHEMMPRLTSTQSTFQKPETAGDLASLPLREESFLAVAQAPEDIISDTVINSVSNTKNDKQDDVGYVTMQPRRTSRVRRAKQEEGPSVFVNVPKSVKKTSSNGSRSRNGAPKQLTLNMSSGLGMTENALRALTSANTLRNQQYFAELDRQFVRVEGKRPDSPTTKVRTTLEKRKELKEQERRERIERRRRRSEPASSPQPQSSEVNSETLFGRHRRGPGEDEDYESPSRMNAKAVKWYRNLVSTSSNEAREKEAAVRDTVQAPKGILAETAKALPLDNFGNLPEAGVPLAGLAQEKIMYTRLVYDDDDDDDDDVLGSPSPEPAKKPNKKRKA